MDTQSFKFSPNADLLRFIFLILSLVFFCLVATYVVPEAKPREHFNQHEQVAPTKSPAQSQSELFVFNIREGNSSRFEIFDNTLTDQTSTIGNWIFVNNRINAFTLILSTILLIAIWQTKNNIQQHRRFIVP